MRSAYKIGDSQELLKELEPSSVDLIVTDPPYGYSFMGKDWDRAVPSVDIWRECLRVLKPGGFAFIMSAPRLDVQSEMARRIQEAGFDIAFTPLFWAYATGFPKAMNVSKAVDKKLGAEREVIGENPVTAGFIRHGRTDEEVFNGTDINRTPNLITAPATPQAKALDGAYAGFQPKPAVEVIIVAMKPLDQKTYVDQALANGKGVTWLDDGRIPTSDDLNGGAYCQTPSKIMEGRHTITLPPTHLDFIQPEGRFPANLLVSDDVLDDGTVRKSSPVGFDFEDRKRAITYAWSKNPLPMVEWGAINDSGGFSRYFSLDKWAERNLPFLIVPKASKVEKNRGLGDRPTVQCNNWNAGGIKAKRDAAGLGMTKNVHPTVKPLKLMSYLITLGSRPGDVVLDPFAGSGTTLLAARMLNRSSIGFELSPEYADILKARTGWVPPPLESFEGGRA